VTCLVLCADRLSAINVDLPGGRLVDDDVCQEGDELRRSVPRRRLAPHFTGSGVECRVQRQRAMTIILKAVPLRSAGRQRQDRVLAVKRLDRRLLVLAEHRRMRRWVHIQPDDVGRFGLRSGLARASMLLDTSEKTPFQQPAR
jgi:hypothetical protein